MADKRKMFRYLSLYNSNMSTTRAWSVVVWTNLHKSLKFRLIQEYEAEGIYSKNSFIYFIFTASFDSTTW